MKNAERQHMYAVAKQRRMYDFNREIAEDERRKEAQKAERLWMEERKKQVAAEEAEKERVAKINAEWQERWAAEIDILLADKLPAVDIVIRTKGDKPAFIYNQGQEDEHCRIWVVYPPFYPDDLEYYSPKRYIRSNEAHGGLICFLRRDRRDDPNHPVFKVQIIRHCRNGKSVIAKVIG